MSGGTRSYEMARRMVTWGHEVHMITSFREEGSGKSGWFTTEEAGIKVHWYPVPYSNHMGFSQRMKAFVAFALAARRKAIALDGDIIFATSTPLTIALPAVPASRKKKIPMVFEVRGLWPEMPIAVGALKKAMSELVVAVLDRLLPTNSIRELTQGIAPATVANPSSSSSIWSPHRGTESSSFSIDCRTH